MTKLEILKNRRDTLQKELDDLTPYLYSGDAATKAAREQRYNVLIRLILAVDEDMLKEVG